MKLTFVRYHEILFVTGNGLVKNMRVVVLVRRSEMVLMKFDRHPDSGRDDLSQQLHVGEDPFVTNGRDSEVSLEQGVKAVQEKLDWNENKWLIISEFLQFMRAIL